MRTYITKIIEQLQRQQKMSTNEISNFLEKEGLFIKKSTLNWRLYELINQGIIDRIGRGQYKLGSKKEYALSVSVHLKKIAKLVKTNFPLLAFCIWDMNFIKSLTQHIPSISFTILEIEKDGKEAVYQKIRTYNPNTFFDNNIIHIENLIPDLKNVILIKTLISEAPVNVVNKIPLPQPEKILVDLFCDTHIFDFLQGNEITHVYLKVLQEVSINKSKLLRYAARRGRRKEILAFLNKITGNNS